MAAFLVVFGTSFVLALRQMRAPQNTRYHALRFLCLLLRAHRPLVYPSVNTLLSMCLLNSVLLAKSSVIVGAGGMVSLSTSGRCSERSVEANSKGSKCVTEQPGASLSKQVQRTYRLTLWIVSALVAFLLMLVMVLVERSTVLTLGHIAFAALRGAPLLPVTPVLMAHTLALLVIPIGSGVLTALVSSRLIELTRVWLYRRALHGYTFDYLEHYAPLHGLQIAPHAVAIAADGTPLSGTAVPLLERVLTSRMTLLIGATAQGKTTELHALAYELTRKRMLWRLYRQKTPLPVLVSLAAYAQSPSESGAFRLQSCLAQVQRLGTAGLAARLETRMRSGSVLLLCDGLDEIPLADRLHIAQELAGLEATFPGTSLVMTYDLQPYVDMPHAIAPLRHAERVLLSGMDSPAIARALKRSHPPSQRGARQLGSDEPADLNDLRAHRLESSLMRPALLGALVELRESGADLPYGQAELLSANDALLAQRELGDAVQPERSLAVLSALASSLRAAGSRTFPIPSREEAGVGMAQWLLAHPPFSPLEYAPPEPFEISQQEAGAICQGALASGILAVRVDGQAAGFAHRLREASFIGRYLSLQDDHLGRLKPEVLRPAWMLPMLLWAALTPDVSHLAVRVLALAETPDSTAARAGLRDRDEVLARSRALALGVVIEGAVPQFGRTAGGSSVAHPPSPDDDHALRATQTLLRDLVDGIELEVSVDESRRERMSDAMGALVRAGGSELLDDIAYLARLPTIERLTRAQLISVLGLVPAPEALDVLLGLLSESDPTLRQALGQAFSLAGDRAVSALTRYLSADDERIRLHAQDIFLTLGTRAEQAACEMLASSDVEQRVAGTRVLGLRQSAGAVDALLVALDDPQPRVQLAATVALGQIASCAAVTALAARVQNPDSDYRMALAGALGSTHQPEALPGLLKLLTDEVPQVRAAAAAALGLLGDLRARSPLQARNADADVGVQSAAASALRRLTYT